MQDPAGPIYKRRSFEPSRHCGEPVDRTPDSLYGRLDIARKTLADLEGRVAAKTPSDRARWGKLLARVTWQRRLIDTIERRLDELQINGPDTRPCCRVKGHMTTHPGVGRCKYHCDCKGNQRFHLSDSAVSKVKHDQTVREVIDDLERANTDLLDMTPDVLLLRAKLQIFISQKTDYEPETVKSLTLLAEQLRKTVDSVVDRTRKSSITADQFNWFLTRMGEAVALYVKDPEILDKIQAAWAQVTLSAPAPRKREIRSITGES